MSAHPKKGARCTAGAQPSTRRVALQTLCLRNALRVLRCGALLLVLCQPSTARAQVADGGDGSVELQAFIAELCAALLDGRPADYDFARASELLREQEAAQALPLLEPGVCSPAGNLRLRHEFLALRALVAARRDEPAAGLALGALREASTGDEALELLQLVELGGASRALLGRLTHEAATRYPQHRELQHQQMLRVLTNASAGQIRRAIRNWMATHREEELTSLRPEQLPAGFLNGLQPATYRAVVHDQFYEMLWRDPAFQLRRARAHAEATREEPAHRVAAIAAYHTLAGWYPHLQAQDLANLRLLDAWDLAMLVELQRCQTTAREGDACDRRALLRNARYAAAAAPPFERQQTLRELVASSESLVEAVADFSATLDDVYSSDDARPALRLLGERLSSEPMSAELFDAALHLVRALQVAQLVESERGSELLRSITESAEDVGLLSPSGEHLHRNAGHLVRVLAQLENFGRYEACQQRALRTLTELRNAEARTEHLYASVFGRWLSCGIAAGQTPTADRVRALVPNRQRYRRPVLYQLLDEGRCELIDELLEDEREVAGDDPETLLFGALCAIRRGDDLSARRDFAEAQRLAGSNAYPPHAAQSALEIALSALVAGDPRGEARADLLAQASPVRSALARLQNASPGDGTRSESASLSLWNEELDATEELLLANSPYIDVLAVRVLAAEEELDSNLASALVAAWLDAARDVPFVPTAYRIPERADTRAPAGIASTGRFGHLGRCALPELAATVRDMRTHERPEPHLAYLLLSCLPGRADGTATHEAIAGLALEAQLPELAHRIISRALTSGVDARTLGDDWLRTLAAARAESADFEADARLLRVVVRALPAETLARFLCPRSSVSSTLESALQRWRSFDPILLEASQIGCGSEAGSLVAGRFASLSSAEQRVVLRVLTAPSMQQAFLDAVAPGTLRDGALLDFVEVAARNGRNDILLALAHSLGAPTPMNARFHLALAAALDEDRGGAAEELRRALREAGYTPQEP